MSEYECPNCGSTNLCAGPTYYGDDEDGIEQYYEDFFCDDCGAQLTFLNGSCKECCTIEQAEEDMK